MLQSTHLAAVYSAVPTNRQVRPATSGACSTCAGAMCHHDTERARACVFCDFHVHFNSRQVIIHITNTGANKSGERVVASMAPEGAVHVGMGT